MGAAETGSSRVYTTKQMGDAAEMLVAAELTLAGIPALKVPDNWPGYDVVAQPPADWPGYAASIDNSDHAPQRVSVKSRTPGKHHSRVGFDPATCDWLAIVLLEDVGRRIFVLPSALAESYSSKPPRARKRTPCHLYFAKPRMPPLLHYKNNFALRRTL